jgi:hypothetical protein
MSCSIEWKVIIKAVLTFVVAPWACTYISLVAIVPSEGAQFWQVTIGAALVGAAYFLSPAAAAYFAARGATQRPIIHALLAVSLGLAAYLLFFDESLLAVLIWPVMGAIGVLTFRRKARNGT